MHEFVRVSRAIIHRAVQIEKTPRPFNYLKSGEMANRAAIRK